MLNAEEWWKVIQNYNQSLWPAQLYITAAGALLSLIFVISPNRRSAVLFKIYLLACFLWNAAVFFLWPGRGFPSPLREVQGGLFIAVGLLMIYDLAGGRHQAGSSQKHGWKADGGSSPSGY